MARHWLRNLVVPRRGRRVVRHHITLTLCAVENRPVSICVLCYATLHSLWHSVAVRHIHPEGINHDGTTHGVLDSISHPAGAAVRGECRGPCHSGAIYACGWVDRGDSAARAGARVHGRARFAV